MAMCKPDLVAGVLKQLGYEVPDAETLTKAVFETSNRLKRESGINEKACLLLSPVHPSNYKGGIRSKTKGFKGPLSV